MICHRSLRLYACVVCVSDQLSYSWVIPSGKLLQQLGWVLGEVMWVPVLPAWWICFILWAVSLCWAVAQSVLLEYFSCSYRTYNSVGDVCALPSSCVRSTRCSWGCTVITHSRTVMKGWLAQELPLTLLSAGKPSLCPVLLSDVGFGGQHQQSKIRCDLQNLSPFP